MAIDKVEYEFPDPDAEDTFEIEIEDVEGRETVQKEAKKPAKEVEAAAEDELEIEVVDDTPKEDRGRKPSAPPEDPTEDELENYSEKVKKRIQHFTKGYHDERRAKEAAQREREELEAFAKRVLEENNKLKGSVNKSQETMLNQAKAAVTSEVELAKRAYREAYESGDTDQILAAQDELTSAKIRMDKVTNFKPAPLQEEQNEVQIPQRTQEQPARDERAADWAAENTWFGSDDEMTSFALGLHNKLVKDGVDPKSDTYYEKINSRMRQVFPDQFDDGIEDEPAAPSKKKASNVVAPATRSTAPKKVTLTRTQVALAKKMGIPLETYAREAAKELRKQN